MDKTNKAIHLNKAYPINYFLILKREETLKAILADFKKFHKKRINIQIYTRALSSIVANLKNRKLVFISLNNNDYKDLAVSFWAVKNLIKFLEAKEYITVYKGFRNPKKQKRTRIEAKVDFLLPFTNEEVVNTKELIILKNSSKEELPLPSNKNIDNIELFLTTYNNLLKKQYLSMDNTILDSGSLFRVFNQSSLKMGGRFFGAYFQTMSKNKRKKLKINGNTTVEYDYSCLHINMLYNLKNKSLNEDAYNIEGFERKIIKFAIMIILNAKDRKTAEKAINFKFIKQKINAFKLTESIIKKHKEISDLFFDPQIGSKLQFLESNIALTVMNHFLKKYIVILPMHDGFICEEEHEKELEKVMNKEYKKSMKFNIEVVKS